MADREQTTVSLRLTPGYWMNETSGVLRPAVETYLNGDDDLTDEQIGAMRAYFRQWMTRGDWRGDGIPALTAAVDGIATGRDITLWLEQAWDQGIDPL